MDKAVLYSYLKQYINDTNKEQIIKDIEHAFKNKYIIILLVKAGVLPNWLMDELED